MLDVENGQAIAFMQWSCKQPVNALQDGFDEGSPEGWPDPLTWQHSMQISQMSED